MEKKVLLVDAAVNLALGVLLLGFSDAIVGFLGVPASDQLFYVNILGAVLFGIGIALILEYYRPKGLVGLGLGGAVSINLCGSLVLIAWLLSGKLSIPFRGQAFLWGVGLIVLLVSLVEVLVHLKRKAGKLEASG